MTKSSLLNFEIPVRWSQGVAGSSTWPRDRHLIAGHSSASSTCWPRTPDPIAPVVSAEAVSELMAHNGEKHE